MQNQYSKLCERTKIGNVKLKNRIIMLPMGTSYASAMGEVTERTIDHYVERAKGGVGLITVGNISPIHFPNAVNQLVLDSEWVLMGHFELVEKVHAQGAKITAQLSYAGRQKYTDARLEEELVSSSALATIFLGETYPTARELTKDEIYKFIERYADAAERAKRVGYDMVELHGGHGYLINQFMSPFMNKRKDEFGGSLQQRMSFPLKLIEAIRQKVGNKFPIGIRISAVEFVPGGVTLKESTLMAKMLENAGVAYISVSAGTFETADKFADLMRDPEGWKEYIWEGIKKVVKIPIVAGGGLRHPDLCERLLEQGKADFIGLARPLLADPEWPRKVKEERTDDIRLCIFCNECLFGSNARRRGGGARRCAVNAVSGREKEFSEIVPAQKVKRVIVIGGGPAGMEAARVAALRGHRVTLYERSNMLGGQLLLAGKSEAKHKVLWLRDYLVGQLKKLRVEVQLGITVTPTLIKKIKPEAIVIATGAEPIMPDFPGLDQRMVVGAWDLLKGSFKPQKERIAVIGGGMIGSEVAEFLLEENEITIIEQLSSIASDMEPFHRFALLKLFKEKKVVTLTRHRVVEISQKGVHVVNLDNNKKDLIEVERTVIAVGTRPVDVLMNALEDKVPELYSVGDCNRPRVIMEAVYEGSLVGRQI